MEKEFFYALILGRGGFLCSGEGAAYFSVNIVRRLGVNRRQYSYTEIQEALSAAMNYIPTLEEQ